MDICVALFYPTKSETNIKPNPKTSQNPRGVNEKERKKEENQDRNVIKELGRVSIPPPLKMSQEVKLLGFIREESI